MTQIIESYLEGRQRQGLLRTLHAVTPQRGPFVTIGGRRLLNFSSNDYLGLASHPLLKERAAAYLERYGTGSAASRLICGNLDGYEVIEDKLAQLKGTEAALVFNSGYQANVTILPAITDRHSQLFLDRACHNSLVMGARLSDAAISRYRHGDFDHLREMLSGAKPAKSRWIVTESVFSMDGDKADLDQLAAIAQENEAQLYVDEAHAVGVLGPQGMGLAAGRPVDITLGTFGKAFGSFGAFVACSAKRRDYLINSCTGLIYTTALPPPVLGAIDAALDLVPSLDQERQRLQAKAAWLREQLRNAGYDTGSSTTQIIPVILGSLESTARASEQLRSQGILAVAIRPPTVPQDRGRVRLALSVQHTKEHLEQLLTALKRQRRLNE